MNRLKWWISFSDCKQTHSEIGTTPCLAARILAINQDYQYLVNIIVLGHQTMVFISVGSIAHISLAVLSVNHYSLKAKRCIWIHEPPYIYFFNLHPYDVVLYFGLLLEWNTHKSGGTFGLRYITNIMSLRIKHWSETIIQIWKLKHNILWKWSLCIGKNINLNGINE